MQPVPRQAEDITCYVAHAPGDEDQDRCPQDLERLDDIDRLDEVNPEKEVDEGLRQAESDEERPGQVPTGEHGGERKTGPVRFDALHGMPLLRLMFFSRRTECTNSRL
jgi:hypothetical protein